MPHADQLTDHERRNVLALFEAAGREARINADLVAHFLDAMLSCLPAARRTEPVPWPREFLLELGFILWLYTWERAGLAPLIAPGLPPSVAALDGLLARYGLMPGPPSGPADGERLSRQVMMIALGRLAAAGRGELRADVALDAPADGRWLEALADFLWKNRRAGGAGG